ncbi:hypothetical protein NCCP2222_13450 [Sporosarcina sp. NCCP-2222]|nr:hypothetical protein NCCP2222_13450 [Sporosarcina sp. NCCP-2222]
MQFGHFIEVVLLKFYNLSYDIEFHMIPIFRWRAQLGGRFHVIRTKVDADEEAVEKEWRG